MLRRNAKQSGESVESVLKKKRKATVGRRLLLAFTNDFLLKASSQGTQKWKKNCTSSLLRAFHLVRTGKLCMKKERQ